MTAPDAPTVPWWEGRLAVLNIGHTADDPRQARLLTATIAHVGGGQATTAWGWLTDGSNHGPTEGLPPARVAREVGHAVYAAWSAGMPLVCCLADRALTILDREVRRHAITDFLAAARHPLDPPGGFPAVGPIIDPVLLDRHFDPNRPGPRDLAAMSAHYQTGVTSSTAVAISRVARRLAHVHPALRDVPVESLNDAQALWYRLREQARAAALREAGLDALADDVCTAWPVRPYRAGDPL